VTIKSDIKVALIAFTAQFLLGNKRHLRHFLPGITQGMIQLLISSYRAQLRVFNREASRDQMGTQIKLDLRCF
jgi:hypothetical protein